MMTPPAMLQEMAFQVAAQSNEWTLLLYEFLNGQPSLLKQSRLVDLPLVRLEDGTHVTPMSSGQPQAFLPGIVETSFPTVAPSVCSTDESRAFLKSLGLQEPDAVADVIRNILPRYRAQNADIAEVSYASDIQRILSAFATDSKSQRDKLVMALRGIPFIKAVDMGDSTWSLAKPEDVYLSTDRLKELFADVGGVRIVDDSIACLRGEDIRELLEACGATRYLRPIFTSTFFTAEERTKMRIAAGYESMSSQDPILDNALRGLDQLLSQLPKFDFDTRQKRSTLLWEALGELEERRGAGIFSGTYCWFYMRQRSTTFDAAFLRQLNDSAWVPTRTGVLERPSYVKFDSLNWKVNPYLQSKIRFKPPIIDSLAIEAGFEPSMLDLLKKLGVTSEAELRLKLGISLEESSHGKPATQSTQQTPSNHSDSSFNAAHPVVNQNSGETHDAGVRHQSELDANAPVDDGAESSKAGKQPGASEYDIGKQEPGSFGSKPFISYVRVAPDEDDHDPDGLGQAARMALEEKAIALILKQEPILQRTPTNNPGFDLFETSADDKTVRWVEVKSMTGGFQDRPVGLSRTQFDLARKCGVAYWLYVVEHTGTERSRVIRIQDPSGKAQTFTFDHGWLEVASKNDNWDRPAG